MSRRWVERAIGRGGWVGMASFAEREAHMLRRIRATPAMRVRARRASGHSANPARTQEPLSKGITSGKTVT